MKIEIKITHPFINIELEKKIILSLFQISEL